MQIQLLRLLLSLVMLEQIVIQQKGDKPSADVAKFNMVGANPEKPFVIRFFVDKVIPEQVKRSKFCTSVYYHSYQRNMINAFMNEWPKIMVLHQLDLHLLPIPSINKILADTNATAILPRFPRKIFTFLITAFPVFFKDIDG
jgi:hypothetical protein